MKQRLYLGGMLASLAGAIGFMGSGAEASALPYNPPSSRGKVFFSGISRGGPLRKIGVKAISVAASKRAARKLRNIRARAAK